MNYEVSYSRGMPPGEYTVNLHLYRNAAGRQPDAGDRRRQRQEQPRRNPPGSSWRPGSQLTREGQELTVFRFRLDAAGAAGARQRRQPAAAPARLAAVMSGSPPLFVVAAVLAATLATISVWAPRRLPVKVGARGASPAPLMPAAYAAMVDLLSKPKPATFEWWLDQADEATVLGSSVAEDRAIYLWLQLDGVSEPRAYVLPWDQRAAEQLQKAAREAAERQAAVRMRLPFEPTLDDREPRFYALPQPALPPKDGRAPRPRSTGHPAPMPDRRVRS